MTMEHMLNVVGENPGWALEIIAEDRPGNIWKVGFRRPDGVFAHVHFAVPGEDPPTIELIARLLTHEAVCRLEIALRCQGPPEQKPLIVLRPNGSLQLHQQLADAHADWQRVEENRLSLSQENQQLHQQLADERAANERKDEEIAQLKRKITGFQTHHVSNPD